MTKKFLYKTKSGEEAFKRIAKADLIQYIEEEGDEDTGCILTDLLLEWEDRMDYNQIREFGCKGLSCEGCGFFVDNIEDIIKEETDILYYEDS
jgi:hypothetical protein